MLTNSEIFQTIIDLIPQWFVAVDWAKKDTEIKIGSENFWISSLRPPTPALKTIKTEYEALSEKYLGQLTTGSNFLDKQLIQAEVVAQWLKIYNYESEWIQLFDYNREIDSRTYENASIGFTFIIHPSETGSLNVLSDTNQKILDVLVDTQYTYFRVGTDWTLLDYNYVRWQDIKKMDSYKLIPEFLYPYQSVLLDKECAVTRTKRGDLIIYDKDGLLASYRKGSWKIYEPRSLKNTLVDLTPGYYIGCNLFSILLDLSYRRHGALIVIDNEGVYRDNIINPSSFISSEGSSVHKALQTRLEGINIGVRDIDVVSKQLILELASVDGATVFNKDGNLLAFGSIITQRPEANAETGARSSAALSAHLSGMRVFKISSDGEIMMYYDNIFEDSIPELIKIKWL